MSPEKNPFLKPPSRPTNKDTAGFIENVLGKKEGDRARRVTGEQRQEIKPTLESITIQLTPEEKTKMEEQEKNRPWTREQVIEWAEKFGENEEWVDSTFFFRDDGFIEVKENLILFNKPITELPRGIQSIGGVLTLTGTSIASLEGLPVAVAVDLYLIDIPATEMPAGVQIGRRIIINKDQTKLIASLKKNGYADKLMSPAGWPIA